MSSQILLTIAIYALPILLAITLHEAAHGYAARRFGDTTAWMLGRVTLNPFKHIDPIGTVLLPGLLAVMGLPIIGYAKPVPVNFMRLKPRRWGMATVALAGPAANLFLLVLSILLLHLAAFLPFGGFIYAIAHASVVVNAVLMLFNLLPIPPLDGSRVLEAILPPRFSPLFRQIEPYAMFIVIGLAVSGLLSKVLLPLLNIFFLSLTPILP